MEMAIIGFFTEPDYHFDIVSELLKLIAKKTEPILCNYVENKIKPRQLEIFLCTDGVSQKRKVIRRFEKSKKYFSFELWLPYYQITENEVVNLFVFVEEFIEALAEALKDFEIPQKNIISLKEEIKAELAQNYEKYAFVLTEQERNYRLGLKKLKAEFAEKYKKTIKS